MDVMYEDNGDVPILSILSPDRRWLNRERKREKKEHLYKFVINWCACCLSEQDVGRGKGRGSKERLY